MTVHFETDGPVAIVTLDRKEARNAVDGPTARELFAAFTRFEEDPGLAVAILTGANGTFCAGADLKAIGTDRQNVVAPGELAPMGPSWRLLGKPVIAAVEGYAVAGGLELALWCDLRVAAESATFGVFCRRFGVPLIDGGTVRLPRIVGHGRALELILTGRPVAAAEALSIGLANRVVQTGQARAHAVEWAKELAALPQACMRSDRLSAHEQWDLPLREALENELGRGMSALGSGEAASGAARFSGGAGRHGTKA
jgi:enoyl-CoA hydratase